MDAMEAERRRYPPYPFGSDFEKRLFALVLKDPTFLRSTTDVVKSEFFANSYCKLSMKLVETHFEKYKATPDEMVFAELVRQEFAKKAPSKEVKANWDAFLHELQSFRLETEAKFLKDQAVRWAQEQAWRRLIEDGAKRIDEGRRTGRSDFADFPKLFDEVRRVGENKFDASMDYFGSLNSRLASYHEIGKNKIPTGLRPLDVLLGGIENGGLERGELGVIAAPTSMGKSAALVQLGCVGGLRAGQRVLAITLELNQINFQRRVDRCISLQTTEQIVEDPGRVIDQVEFVKLFKGELRVMFFPAMKNGVKEIEEQMLRMKSDDGWEPSVLVVDYATLLGTDRERARARERRFEIEENILKLRALAQEHNLAVWTAHQTNRKSIEKMHQGTSIGVEDVSEAFSISQHCDVMITINQTKEERAEDFCRFIIAKNREGIANKEIPLHFDTACHRFEELGPGVFLPEHVQPASQSKPSPVRDKIRATLEKLFSTTATSVKFEDVKALAKDHKWAEATLWRVIKEDFGEFTKKKIDGEWRYVRETPEPATTELEREADAKAITEAQEIVVSTETLVEMYKLAGSISPKAPIEERSAAWLKVLQAAEHLNRYVDMPPEIREQVLDVKKVARRKWVALTNVKKAPKNKEASNGQSTSKK
jgi:replicative DNA helicase